MDPARPMNPLEKVKELAELRLTETISADQFRTSLGQIRTSLVNAVQALKAVDFPADYLPGPKLQEAAIQAFELLEKALVQLDSTADSPDAGVAGAALDLASQAYQVLEQALKAIQNLRLRGQ